MKYLSFLIIFLLLIAISPSTFARYTPETFQQTMALISLNDDDAEQKTLALLSSVQEEKQPALAVKTLLFLMKIQQKNKRYDDVLMSYHKLVLIAEENQFNKIKVEALFLLAKNERILEKNKAALKIIEDKVIPQAKIYAPELLGEIYSEASNNVAIIPDFEKFTLYFQLAEDTYKAENNFIQLTRTLVHKSNYLASYGNIKAALSALVLASKYQLELDDKRGLFSSYRALGRLSHELENYQQAIAYYQKAHALKLNSKKHLASLNFSMAYAFYELQQYDNAILWVDKSILLIGKSTSKRNLATALLGKASILIKMKRFKASLATLNKVNTLSKVIKSGRINEDLHLTFAKYYLGVDNIQPALKSVQAALAINTVRIAMNIDKYQTASEIYDQAGDFEKSLLYLRKLRELELEKSKVKTEKIVIQQQNEINLLNAQKNTALVKQQLLENQNNAQLQKVEQQKIWFYGSILLLFIFTLFSFFYLRQGQKKSIALEQSKSIMALMEQKNSFIANVAHDLKNPLTVMQVHLEALKDGMVKDPEKAHHILNQRLVLLTNIIDDLRQVSLVEMGLLTLNPRVLFFKSWLNQEISAHLPLVESKGLSFKAYIELSNTASVNADQSRLSQVFANLIKNSLRYTKQPGKLIIIAKQHPKTIELIIKDSSPAVAENELTDVFNHGYRSHSTQAISPKSSGLGLYICKEIIKAHQGTISASLSNFGGLSISITIPLMGK